MMMRLVEHNKYAVVLKEKMMRGITREDPGPDGLASQGSDAQYDVHNGA